MAEPAVVPQKPISTWIRADHTRPYCARPWRQLTVLSDGDVICACPDASKTNPLGNVFTSSVDEVWNGPAMERLRRNIEEDIDRVPVCRGCPNRLSTAPPKGFHTGVAKPRALYIETVGGCNVECPGCNRETIVGSRKRLAMTYDQYVKVVDELSPDLLYVEFYLAGENWAHPRAADMVKYTKDRNPRCLLQTSTNGLFFHTEERARAAVESGIDCIVCSIDGSTQEVYEKGKIGGRLDVALEGMRRLLRWRKELGRTKPLVIWRYLMFAWNTEPEQMDHTRRLAREIGVDHLAWHLNADRPELNSKRYYIGSPHLHEIAHELWDTLPARLGWRDPVGLGSYPLPGKPNCAAP